MSYVWMTETYFPFAAANIGYNKNTQAACTWSWEMPRHPTREKGERHYGPSTREECAKLD